MKQQNSSSLGYLTFFMSRVLQKCCARQQLMACDLRFIRGVCAQARNNYIGKLMFTRCLLQCKKISTFRWDKRDKMHYIGTCTVASIKVNIFIQKIYGNCLNTYTPVQYMRPQIYIYGLFSHTKVWYH